jgi:hypothetical protein
MTSGWSNPAAITAARISASSTPAAEGAFDLGTALEIRPERGLR